jgi:hypothetical protein
MAYTFKNKRLAYDNIASGSAAGRERHILGSAGVGDATTREVFDNVKGTSDACVNSSFIANKKHEHHMGMGGETSSGDWTGQPSSATSPYRTSGSSDTSAIGELL